MKDIEEVSLVNNCDLLFVSLDWSRPKDLRTPLSAASIEAYFKNNQSENTYAEFINFNLNSHTFNIGNVKSSIKKFHPRFLAFGAYIWNENYVPDLIDWTKKHFPGTKIILGGPQVTYGNYLVATEYPGVDYFIAGEGEVPLTELIAVLSLNKVPTQEFMSAFAIYTPDMLKNTGLDNKYIGKLDKLPSPYLSQILPIKQNQLFVRWETLRRCPYKCTFCQFHLNGYRVAEIDHDRLFEELKYFKEKNVQEINVLNPIFNLKPNHYLEICRMINALEMQCRFYLQCRLELLCNKPAQEFLEFCKDNDVWLEFGIQTFREKESDAVKRNNNYERIDKAIDILHDFNIPFDLHLIFGLPFQSFKDFRWNYDKALQAYPSGLYLFPLNILKGTELYHNREKWEYEFDIKNNNILLKSK